MVGLAGKAKKNNFLVDGRKEHGPHLVGLVGKPAHSKDDHNNHKHLDHLENAIVACMSYENLNLILS